MARKDENGFYMPERTERSYAEGLPSADVQRPKEDEQPRREKNEDSGKEKNKGPIGVEEIREARQRMIEYFGSKRLFDIRYRMNFDIYNLMYNENADDQIEFDDSGNPRKKLIPERVGAQTLNVILNKHADAMDNYPEPTFLPRSRDDEETARLLTSIVPCILDWNKFEETYDNLWTDKLVGGADGVAVLWDSELDNGLGNIGIFRVNLLNMAWAPFIDNIQDSPDLFLVSYEDPERVKEAYPELSEISSEDLGLEGFTTYHSVSETQNKAAVVDWYYKRGGVLHYCKFCGDHIIFASENEDRYNKGFYHHGKYPFVVKGLFKLRRTPVGFGFIDICRPMQQALDAVKRDVLKNIRVNSQTRSLVDDQAIVNFDDLSDLSVEFIKANGGELSRIIHPIDTKDIAPGALSMYNAFINEIKDTTGTNDPSNGAGSAGVTSGAAIAALQEAGGKISRDINKGGFREFEEICELILELIRQFYNPARCFRIVGEDKEPEYIEFDNEGLQPKEFEIEGVDGIFKRLPVFDIKVKAQRSNPYTTAANNQMMVDMFRMGAFAPENAEAAQAMLEGMSFEGKDKISELIKQNSLLMQQFTQMAQQQQMADAMIAQQAADSLGAQAGAAPAAMPTQL